MELQRARRAKISVCMVAAVWLISCSPGSDADSTVPEPELPDGATTMVTDPAELVLPLDAYRYTEDGYRDLLHANSLLSRACLERFGVDSPEPAPPSEVSTSMSFDNLNERRYGLLDLDAAAERGYNALPESDQEDATQRPEGPSEYVYFLLEGRTRADFADRSLPLDRNGEPLPEDGCNGEAIRILTDGEPEPNLGLPDALGGETYRLAENDSRVRAAMAAWSSCMAARGYRYDTIWEPNDTEWPEPATGEEIATAVADVECKLETNVVGIWYAVESAYQQPTIEQHADELAELEQWLESAYRNAAQVIARA